MSLPPVSAIEISGLPASTDTDVPLGVVFAADTSLAGGPLTPIRPSEAIRFTAGADEAPVAASPEAKAVSASSFHINIVAGPLLSANQAALAALQRAAAQWEARIADPIVVNVDVELRNLGSPTIIGQADTVALMGEFDLVRDQVVVDAADEPDDAIAGSLPASAQYAALLPEGFGLSGYLAGSKANLKALGFEGLDEEFGATDATIELNSGFAFDYDNQNGVDWGKIDFETVAAHELGHSLGFLSAVDDVDYLLDAGVTADMTPYVLDLLRFSKESPFDPANPSEFATFARSLAPGSPDITDEILSPWGDLSEAEFPMSTGAYTGDRRQASHWKDDDLLGRLVGVMDPTLNYGGIMRVSESDLRALDLLGYEIRPVPEPGVFSLLAAGLLCLAIFRRRHRHG